MPVTRFVRQTIRHIFILEPTAAVRRILLPGLKRVAQTDCFASFDYLVDIMETGFLPEVLFLPMSIARKQHIHLLVLRMQFQRGEDISMHILYFTSPLSTGHLTYQLPEEIRKELEPVMAYRLRRPSPLTPRSFR